MVARTEDPHTGHRVKRLFFEPLTRFSTLATFVPWLVKMAGAHACRH